MYRRGSGDANGGRGRRREAPPTEIWVRVSGFRKGKVAGPRVKPGATKLGWRSVIDAEHDTFRAEIEGTLYYGMEKDTRIDFKAYLNADP